MSTLPIHLPLDATDDPEMLGKVFENLLEERDRGQSGSFYTPRVIVAYMCQEALAGYLADSAKVDRDLVRGLFDPDGGTWLTADQAIAIDRALDTFTVLDPAVGSGSFLIGMLTEIIRLRRLCAIARDIPIIPALLADWKEAVIRDTLYGVDIKPEAIEVAQLRLWLALIVDQTLDQARPLPNLDYKLMAGNSLIETIDGEPVLSSLAESLIDSADGMDEHGVPIVPFQTNMFREPVQVKMDLFATEQVVTRERLKLDQLRRSFFRAKPDDRTQLRKEIVAQERQIVYASLHEKSDAIMPQIGALGKKAGLSGLSRTEQTQLAKLSTRLERLTGLEQDLANPNKPLPFFLYRMHFHEVFAGKGGFDVVIANPPYVRQEQITAQKPELQAAYPDVYAGTADLYVYFYARGLSLARPNGTLIYITPNKFMRAGYGKRLRDHLRKHVAIQALTDFGDLPLFDATTYPLIVALKKAEPIADHAIRALTVTSMEDANAIGRTSRTASALPQSALTDSEWQLSDPAVRALMAKLRASGQPLGEYVNGKIYYGIKTGFNEAFVIDGAKRTELIAADPKSAEIIKPYLRGRDVKRWKVEPPDLYLIAIQNSGDQSASNAWAKATSESEAREIFKATYPAVHDHLSTFEKQLRVRQDQGRYWWELRACAYYAEFEKPKIVYPNILKKPEFAFDTKGLYTNQKCFIIPTTDAFLCAVLNSPIMMYFFQQSFPTLRGGFFEPGAIYMKYVPIPTVPEALRTKIGAVAEKCLAAAQDHPDRLPGLESQLNKLVYQAYGLTEEEIRLVEGTGK